MGGVAGGELVVSLPLPRSSGRGCAASARWADACRSFPVNSELDADSAGLRLSVHAGGSAQLEVRVGDQIQIELRERGASSGPIHSASAITYETETGDAYWVPTRNGFEQWIHVRFASGQPIAEWDLTGGRLHSEGDAVVVVDRKGWRRLRITAPKAFDSAGVEHPAWLVVRGTELSLHTTARGEVLVDPLWQSVGDMGSPRTGHVAVLDKSGGVLVAGGVVATPIGGQTGTEEYLPANQSWRSLSGPFANCTDATSVRLGSGDILAVCQSGSQLYHFNTFFNQLWWDSVGPPVVARGYSQVSHTMTLLPSGKVLITGGIGLSSGQPVRSTEIYDPDTRTWSPGPPMSVERAFHTATLLDSGKVLVAGGSTEALSGFLASAEVYDPAANGWSPTATPMNDARRQHVAVRLANGQVLIAGGLAGVPNGPFLSSAELFEPGSGTWTRTASMRLAHRDAIATPIGPDRVLVVGGDLPSPPTGLAEVYDVVEGRWRDSGNLASPRLQHTATLLDSGVVLLAGGRLFNTQPTSSAEEYSPLTIHPSTFVAVPRSTIHLDAGGGSGSGYTFAAYRSPSGGSVESSSGTYKVGPAGSVTDIVQLTDSGNNVAKALITVGPGVTIVPGGWTVPPRGMKTFAASGGSGQDYTFSVATNGSGGTIDATTGAYAAGATGDTSDVISVSDPLGNNASANITVSASVTISPSQITLRSRESQAFSAAGGSGTGFVWSFVSNASGGSLNPSTGVYTAGNLAGTDVVGVADSLGNLASAKVSVTDAQGTGQAGGCKSAGNATGSVMAWLVVASSLLVRRRGGTGTK